MLFDRVPVADDEQEKMRGLGFDLQHDKEDTFFRLPCPMFVGQICGVYQDRPDICQKYRCALLRKVESDEVSLEGALAVVDEAKILLATGRALANDQAAPDNADRLWRIASKQLQDKDAGRRREGNDAQLVLQMAVVNLFLDRHFRNAKKRDETAK